MYVTIFRTNILHTIIKFTCLSLYQYLHHIYLTRHCGTAQLHCLKAVYINVLYILCIGHLTDVVPERTKQCVASNKL